MEVAFHSQDFRCELYPVLFVLDQSNSEDRLQNLKFKLVEHSENTLNLRVISSDSLMISIL